MRTIRSKRLKKFKKKHKNFLVICNLGLIWYLVMFATMSFPLKSTNALFIDQSANKSTFQAGNWKNSVMNSQQEAGKADTTSIDSKNLSKKK